MFGIGMPELILILVIALLIFGPKKLPEISKALGKGMHELKKAGDDLKETWETEVQAQEEEAQRLQAAQADSTPAAASPEALQGTAGEEIYGSPSLAYPGEEELLHPPQPEEAGASGEAASESHAPEPLVYPAEEELAKPAPPTGAGGGEGSSKTHG